MDEVVHEGQVLKRHRPVEPPFFFEAGNLGWSSSRTNDRPGDVARDQVLEEEREDSHTDDDDHRLRQAPEDETGQVADTPLEGTASRRPAGKGLAVGEHGPGQPRRSRRRFRSGGRARKLRCGRRSLRQPCWPPREPRALFPPPRHRRGSVRSSCRLPRGCRSGFPMCHAVNGPRFEHHRTSPGLCHQHGAGTEVSRAPGEILGLGGTELAGGETGDAHSGRADASIRGGAPRSRRRWARPPPSPGSGPRTSSCPRCGPCRSRPGTRGRFRRARTGTRRCRPARRPCPRQPSAIVEKAFGPSKTRVREMSTPSAMRASSTTRPASSVPSAPR